MQIGKHLISDTSPVFIIAELSANHNQDINIAIESVKKAKEMGADAIKLQTYTADTLTLPCDNEYFQIKQGTLWDGQTLYNLYKQAYTPWEWFPILQKVANEVGITIFSSPFDFSSVDFLEKLNFPAYKIASFEINDIPLIKYVASKNKPVIISTGIAELSDIELAVETCKKQGNNDFALLKCTSAYPAPIEEANLLTMQDMKRKFQCQVGLSDHTMGTTVPIVSVALGAKIIEKHFILDKSVGGPDAEFSLDTKEFSELIKSVREAELALGTVNYTLSEKIKKNKVFTRSLFISADMNAGDVLNEKNIRSIRPGYGLQPKYYEELLGKKVNQNIKMGTPVSWELIEK